QVGSLSLGSARYDSFTVCVPGTADVHVVASQVPWPSVRAAVIVGSSVTSPRALPYASNALARNSTGVPVSTRVWGGVMSIRVGRAGTTVTVSASVKEPLCAWTLYVPAAVALQVRPEHDAPVALPSVTGVIVSGVFVSAPRSCPTVSILWRSKVPAL